MSETIESGPGEAPATPPAGAPRAPLPPLTGSRLVTGTIALSLATFMNVLDSSIANVSIPSIAGDTGVSPSQGTWVITSFAVSSAISVPLTGWLAQRFGQVRVFMSATILFTLASLLCALAPNLQSLILFRILQGAVAGPMIPMSQALLLSSYPPARAGTAMALWAMTTLVAPIIGPPLGGWLSDNLSWPWIFYVNLPVGLFAAWVTWGVFRHRESPVVRRPVDYVGLVLLVIWVSSLQVLLDEGRELDWFSSDLIVGLTAVAVVGFAAFVIWETTDEHPIVDLSLFSRRNFLVGTAALALSYGVFFGNVVLVPLWLQQYLNYTATEAGIVLAPVGVLALLLSPLVGRNIHRTDPRLLASGSFVVFAVVLTMRSLFTSDADFGSIMLPAWIQGIAIALMFVPMTTILLSGLPPERIPAATGLSSFCRMLMGAVGTSLTTTLWDNRAQLHHARLAEAIDPMREPARNGLDALQGAGLPSDGVLGLINRLVDVESYTLAADEIFFASALIMLSLVVLVWTAHPRRTTTPGATVPTDGGH